MVELNRPRICSPLKSAINTNKTSLQSLKPHLDVDSSFPDLTLALVLVVEIVLMIELFHVCLTLRPILDWH